MITIGDNWTKRRLALELMGRNTQLVECTVLDVESLIQTVAEVYVDSVSEVVTGVDKKQTSGDVQIRKMLMEEGSKERSHDDVHQTRWTCDG